MSPVICWGGMAKSADSTQTIEQAIEQAISAHNADPDAHAGAGESIDVHRGDYPLDHPYGTVTPPHLTTPAKTATVYVDPAGGADYTDLATAIAAVYASGGGTVYLKPGVYPVTTAVTLKAGVNVIGEDPLACILDITTAQGRLELWPDRDVYGEGTITFTKSSKTVAGVATNFLSYVQAGDYINNPYSNDWYKITTVNSNTQLTLKNTYTGKTRSGIVTLAGPMTEKVILSNFSVRSNQAGYHGITLAQCLNVTLDNVHFEDEDTALLSLYYCYKTTISNVKGATSGEWFIRLEGCDKCNIISTQVANNNYAGYAAITLSGCNQTTIINCQITGCTGKGVGIYGGLKNIISSCAMLNNTEEGILISQSSNNVVEGCQSTNNGTWGVVITAGATYNLVHGNQLRDNTSGTISDSGTNNQKLDNII